jgi:FkbM family methyltransferase
MTPLISIRSFTNDQFQLDKVFYSNCYGLKGYKKDAFQPVVADIGAHCGYFTFNAAACGAKKVYSFEPFESNYQVLVKNSIEIPMCPIRTFQLGAYTHDATLALASPVIENGMFFDYAKLKEQGNILFSFPVFSLDRLIKDFIKEKVDILKINIGYAERHILANMTESKVDFICGESELDDKAIADFKSAMFKNGFIFSNFKKSESEEGKVIFHFGNQDLSKVFNIIDK